MKKIYVGHYYDNYLNWILPLGFVITRDKSVADCAFFAGGEDVSPYLYGEKNNHLCYNSYKRDQEEVELWQFCQERNIPKIGVCRGHQLLCVLAGSKMVQDIKHPGMHEIKTSDGEKFVCNSLHHQNPLIKGTKNESDFEILAWAEKLSPFHCGPNESGEIIDYKFDNSYKEPEVVYNAKANFLGIQSHPELMNFDRNGSLMLYFQSLVSKYILKSE